jgi:aspartate aminotransferase
MRSPATRLQQLNGEGALAVFARARELERDGRSIVHLELGEPDFHPADLVVEAATRALREGRDRYVAPEGIPALREAISAYLSRTRGLHLPAENVLVTPGCKMALALACLAVIEPGSEVLYPEPSFPIYPSLIRALGAVPVPFRLLESNAFQPDGEEIAAKASPRTTTLILNSPNNPTGTVYTPAVLVRLAALAVQRDLMVISDEVYARIVFGGEYPSICALPGMAERTLLVDGFSKSFAMTGWRLGYVVAPPELRDGLKLLIMNSFTCAAEFTQHAAVEALRDSGGAVEKMVAQYASRREQFVAGLNAIPGFRCLPPDGAFYAWVNITGTGLSAEALGTLLLEEAGVAGIAGAAFGPSGKDFLRFSFAASSELLTEAVERIRRISARWETKREEISC